MEKYQRLPLMYLVNEFESWKDVLDLGEVGQVFFAPFGDGSYRAYQFRDWLIGKQVEVEVEVLDMQAELVDDAVGLAEALKNQEKAVIVLARKAMMTPELPSFMAVLGQEGMLKSGGVLVFHEGFVSEMEEYQQELPAGSMQHVMVHPLYPREVVAGFVEELAGEWGLKVPLHVGEEIYSHCGGYLWLAKDVLRQMKLGKGKKVEDCVRGDSFEWKARQIWMALPRTHQDCILGNPQRESVKRGVRDELDRYGFYLDGGESKWPGYVSLVVEKMVEDSLVVTEMEVAVAGRDVTHAFSEVERKVLAFLHDKAGKVVERDVLAQVYWGEGWEEKYSDWAMDQVMSRLRKKVRAAGLPVNIKTVRGKGYVCG